MTQSRRDFLRLMTYSVAALAGGTTVKWMLPTAGQALAAEINHRTREYLMLCDKYPGQSTTIDKAMVTPPGMVKALDVSSQEVIVIDVPFCGHTVNQNPLHPEQIVSFEKWGKRGALIDFKQRDMLEMIEISEDNQFFGHAAFNADGSVLITSEDNGERTKGQLILRDASSLKIIDKMPSFGTSPHECRYLNNGETVVVVNAGYQASSVANMSWVDFKSGKLLHQIEFAKEHTVKFSHFDIAEDGWICVVGIPTDEKSEIPLDVINFVSPSGEVFVPVFPANIKSKIKYEALSVAFLGNTGLAAATVPKANLILIFDYKKQAMVDAIEIDEPQGIVPYMDSLGNVQGLLGSLRNSNKHLISVVKPSDQPATVSPMETAFGGVGSHLVRLYI